LLLADTIPSPQPRGNFTPGFFPECECPENF
jgi:hypothetical protein